MKNPFFKPTKMYKEYKILNMIDESSRMTQREMSHALNIAVSMVNQYLDDFEEEGLIKRIHQTRKTVDYKITKKGIKRKNFLNIQYLSSTQKLYDLAEFPIVSFMKGWIEEGLQSMVIYGAGEVAEIILNTYFHATLQKELKFKAIIDDDASKNGKTLYEIPINSFEETSLNHVDAILIAAYTHQNQIIEKLKAFGYPSTQIKTFF